MGQGLHALCFLSKMPVHGLVKYHIFLWEKTKDLR